MDSFSWRDTARAVFGQCTCIPCFSSGTTTSIPSSQGQHIERNSSFYRNEELENLLNDDSDTDALSLHSNFGRGRGRVKGKKRKSIVLFGYDLFGRTGPGLNEEDVEDGEQTSALVPPPRRKPAAITSHSSSTLDSDPTPLTLSDSRLRELSKQVAAPLTNDQLRAEEEAQRDKEERRAARRLRKEMKKAAATLAAQSLEGSIEGGEGHWGGHAYYGQRSPYSPVQQMRVQMYGDISGCEEGEEFGPFEVAKAAANQPDDEDEDIDDADFGAENYNHTRRPMGGSRASGSATSRTSETLSVDGYEYVDPGNPSLLIPSAHAEEPVQHQLPSGKKTKKKKRSSSKSKSSQSVPSPIAVSPTDLNCDRSGP